MRTLQGELVEKGLHSKQKYVDPSVKGTRKEEKLTTSELRELMGVNRDTFKRIGGSIRRR